MTIGYHTPAYRSDDQYALQLLGDILGSGQTSRLDRLLVNSVKPLCVNASASAMALEDDGLFMISAMVLQGQDPNEVENTIIPAITEVIEKGVTAEELDKAKMRQRVGKVRSRQTAERIASQLGQETLFGGDPNRVNTELEKINAVTPADVQAVAQEVPARENSVAMVIEPGDAPGAPRPPRRPPALLPRRNRQRPRASSSPRAIPPSRRWPTPKSASTSPRVWRARSTASP